MKEEGPENPKIGLSALKKNFFNEHWNIVVFDVAAYEVPVVGKC